MLRRFALEQDVARRISRAQEMMKEKGLGALFIPAHGAPGLMGMAKYFTNIQLWAGPAWVVLGSDHPEPALIQWSSYGSDWNRQDATTSWVENPDPDALGRAIEIARDFTRANKKVGIEHLNSTWKVGDWTRLQQELSDVEFVDVTKELDALRSIKSAFEIEENYNMGRIMSDAFDAFTDAARPGIKAWDAAAASEAVLKAEGCFWGRSKYSFDLRPQTIPTPLDRVFTEDDIFIFELVYTSPLGYWSEVTALYSFKPLPSDIQAQIDAQERVIEACAMAATPGTPIGHIADVTTQTWTDLGFKVIGKHTPNCHSIGLDESDGPSSWFTPKEELKANIILSFHPSGLLEGNRAFLISDNFLVTPQGAVRLSPKNWIYKLIES
jgi:Xaa-Pro aminopeptidase